MCVFIRRIFWTSFYEQGAQVRIPTSDDPASLQVISSGVAIEESHASFACQCQSHWYSIFNSNTFNPNLHIRKVFLSPHKFQSGLCGHRERVILLSRCCYWVPIRLRGMSLESPLVRLDRELREFDRADPQPVSTSASIGLSPMQTLRLVTSLLLW
jgi:DASH complex subunit ASK1